MIGNLTRICSTCPDQLGKTFTLTPDGTLCKTTAGQMVQGTYTTETFSTVADLAAILKDTTTSEALSASLPTSGQVKGRVVTEKALAANPGAVARTKRHFGLPSGQAGFMCLDADVPKDGQPLTREQLWALTLSLCPDAASTGVVYWPSGSSFIHEGSHQHKGIGGQHLYLLVSDISDTERAGRTLTKRLWLAGHGRVDVSASGALLLRSVFDDAVHQPARLLFVGGAVCTPPLEQRRGLPLILSEGGFLDTKHAIPDLTPDEEGRYLALVESAKARAEPQARAAQQAWRDARKKAHLSQAVAQGQDLQQAKEQIERTLDAALGGSLLGTFPLVLVNDEGREQTVSVDSVLKERARFHLARCLDPLNNDHRARTPDAILYLQQAQPVIYSLDEGGVIYRLLRQPARLAVTSGDKARLAEQIADELRHEQDLFALSGQVVRVAGGQFAAMSRPMLHYRIGCRVSL